MADHTAPDIVEQDSNGEPVTTSLIIAEGVHAQHKNVRELIEDNLADFEEFGVCRFKTAKPATSANSGGRPRKVAILNRDQALLLMTYLRNTAIVRQFKKDLVRAFGSMERRLANHADTPPHDYAAALRELADTYEARQRAELRAGELERQAAIDAPKVGYFDDFVDDRDLIQVRTLASQLNVSEKWLRDLLISKHWIYRIPGKRWSASHNCIETVNQYRPYAPKRHLFQLVPCHTVPRINGEVQQTLKLTARGIEAVARLVRRVVGTPVLRPEARVCVSGPGR